MLTGLWAAQNSVCHCSCPGNFSLNSLSSKSKSFCFLPFLTINMDFPWVSRTIKASPTNDSCHSFAVLGWQEIKGEILRDNCRRIHEDNKTGQQPQLDSDTQQSLKYWLVTFSLLSSVLIKTFLLQVTILLFFFSSSQGCLKWKNPKATWNMWWQATDHKHDLESSSSVLNI